MSSESKCYKYQPVRGIQVGRPENVTDRVVYESSTGQIILAYMPHSQGGQLVQLELRTLCLVGDIRLLYWEIEDIPVLELKP